MKRIKSKIEAVSEQLMFTFVAAIGVFTPTTDGDDDPFYVYSMVSPVATYLVINNIVVVDPIINTEENSSGNEQEINNDEVDVIIAVPRPPTGFGIR